MKPASLSMRLGLTVSILGALLVVFLAILAYFALTHELNALARDSLKRKWRRLSTACRCTPMLAKSAENRTSCSIR